MRGRFLNVFGLEAYDYWIWATADNNPLYPPFLRGNPNNSRYSRHLPIGVRRKNLPLTALVKGVRGIFQTRLVQSTEDDVSANTDDAAGLWHTPVIHQILAVNCIAAVHEYIHNSADGFVEAAIGKNEVLWLIGAL